MTQEEINNFVLESLNKIGEIIEGDTRIDKLNRDILESLKNITSDLIDRVDKIERQINS